jgi:hypothetical protein
MAKKRKSERDYGHRYHRVNGIRGEYYWLCVYCGMPAGTIEHYPPLSKVELYESNGGRIYITFPSCITCNLLAANVLDETFLDRVERIKDRMAVKYKRYVEKPEWDDRDIEELGPSLRSLISVAEDKGRYYRAKIENYGGVDMVLDHLERLYGDR